MNILEVVWERDGMFKNCFCFLLLKRQLGSCHDLLLVLFIENMRHLSNVSQLFTIPTGRLANTDKIRSQKPNY